MSISSPQWDRLNDKVANPIEEKGLVALPPCTGGVVVHHVCVSVVRVVQHYYRVEAMKRSDRQ